MKKLILSTFVLAAFLAAEGKTITPEEALERASSTDVRHAPAMGASPRLSMTVTTAGGAPAAYLFNKGDRGYMILSADDVAVPVLGYSDSGTINPADMPPQLKWWLDEYAAQIQYAAENGAEPIDEPLAVSDKVIDPLLKTTWDQLSPYNSQCPLSRGSRTPTGCAATAVAQVMKYWNYPECGRDSISYTASYLGKRLSMKFANHPFEWDKMIDDYTGTYTEEQSQAVATLMKAVGYSLKMNYNSDASSAFAKDIAPALVKYFDYDPNINYVRRVNHSPAEWQHLLIENLDNVGPIPYGGYSTLGGGHEFVCDGYDGKGYFHINWGWSGMSDGYFLLDVLTPASLGTGGGGGGGYNFMQDAVLGIQPPTGKPAVKKQEISQNGSVKATLSASSLVVSLYGDTQVGWANRTDDTLSFKMGIIVESLSDDKFEPVKKVAQSKFTEVPSGYYTSTNRFTVNLNKLIELPDGNYEKLPDGKYKVTVATLFEDTQAWVPVQTTYGSYNYVVVTKEDGKFAVEAYQQAELKIEGGKMLTKVYYDQLVEVEVTVSNPCDIAYSGGFAPVLFNKLSGQPTFLGESVRLTLEPGQTVTHKWITYLNPVTNGNFGLEEKDYEFTFYNEMNGTFYNSVFSETVTMYPMPPIPNLAALDAPFIEDAESEPEWTEYGYFNVYKVKDKRHIRVASDFQLVSGILATWIYNIVMTPGRIVGEQFELEMATMAGQPVFAEEEFSTHTIETEIDFASAKVDQLYFVTLGYIAGNKINIDSNLTAFRIVDNSGVESVSVETPDAPVEVFDLQGKRVGNSTDSLAPGIYIVRQGNQAKKLYIR